MIVSGCHGEIVFIGLLRDNTASDIPCWFLSPGSSDVEFRSEEERNQWEEEQRRLDREWYGMDEGYDDEHNPFSGTSAEYTRKKEEELEQRKKKRMSEKQRQINKVKLRDCGLVNKAE